MNHLTFLRNPKAREGSALLSTVIISILIGFIIASTLPMVLNNYKANMRESMTTAAFNLAEAGAEQALWSIKQVSTAQDMIDNGWNLDDSGDYLSLEINVDDLTWQLDSGMSGRIRIVTENPEGASSVQVWVEGYVAGNSKMGDPISRILSIQAGTSSPHIGLIAIDQLRFNGQPSFDSYDSDVFPFLYFSGVNSGQNVTVGSVSTAAGSVSLGNANIYGNVVTGAIDPEGGAISGNANLNITGEIIGGFEMDLPEIIPPTVTEDWETSF